MAYVCPVCDTPQADGEHLANHLAFTAMLHDDRHGAWLDERVPDWGERDPEELAEDVVDRVPETDHGIETEGRDHDPPRFEGAIERRSGRGRRSIDEETERVLEEARELTARMYREKSQEE